MGRAMSLHLGLRVVQAIDGDLSTLEAARRLAMHHHGCGVAPAFGAGRVAPQLRAATSCSSTI